MLKGRQQAKSQKMSILPARREPVPGFSFEEESFLALGYRIIDEVAAYLSGIAERPVWQPMPAEVRAGIRNQKLPEQGRPFEETLACLCESILPYSQGNGHPRFAGWINSAPADRKSTR